MLWLRNRKEADSWNSTSLPCKHGRKEGTASGRQWSTHNPLRVYQWLWLLVDFMFLFPDKNMCAHMLCASVLHRMLTHNSNTVMKALSYFPGHSGAVSDTRKNAMWGASEVLSVCAGMSLAMTRTKVSAPRNWRSLPRWGSEEWQRLSRLWLWVQMKTVCAEQVGLL